MSLRANNLAFAAGGQPLLKNLSLSVGPGEFHAILGPNGAGKSTLLRLLARDLKPVQGGIELNGRALPDWDAVALARQRAVLPQNESLRFAFTVNEVVALGRLPCRRNGAARELQIIDEALRLTDALHLRARLYPTLSGGERQRVQLARVLVQIWESADQPRYLLLDEPTASLDLRHQHECLRIARSFASQGVGVIAVLHDPNLALRYADQVLLLQRGQQVAQGPSPQVLTAAILHQVFGINAAVIEHDRQTHLLIS